MIRILFLLVLFLSSASFLHAQQIDSQRSGNIVVTVREVYRNAKIPVDSVIVSVISTKDSTVSQIKATGSNGVITFRVPKGGYIVTVTKTNYTLIGRTMSKTGSDRPTTGEESNLSPGSVFAYVKVRRRRKTVTLAPVMEREKPKKVKKEVRLVPVKDE